MTQRSAPDPFADWMTLPEAAAQHGCTRQNIHSALKNGHLEGRQFTNGLRLIKRDEFARWSEAAKRSEAASRASAGLSARQIEMLIHVRLHGTASSASLDNPSFLSTAQSLRKRGLLEPPPGVRLTEDGRRVAAELAGLVQEELESPE